MNRKNNFFTSVPAPRVPKNSFDLSHEVKMSGKFGFLYPVLLLETMPNDTITDQIVTFLRAAPMLAPIMHQVKIKLDAFFVPFRILNGEVWEEFSTGGQDGVTAVVPPYFTPAGVKAAIGAGWEDVFIKGTLWDYFGGPVLEGAPPAAASTEQLSLYPYLAYQKIWNDWFRDPNLSTELEWDIDMQGDQSVLFSTLGGTQLYELRSRGWERESYTAALPWPQRGAEVLVPMETTGSLVRSTVTGLPATASKDVGIDPLVAGRLAFGDSFNPAVNSEAAELVMTNSSITINDLRASFAMQRWMEINARSGGRYIEQIKGQYDQQVPDYRLQRAEYIGGGRATMTISEVLSTADTATVPVGDMAGHGVSVGKNNRFSYHCQEHGFVMVILSVVPTPAYMQGLPKLWSKKNRFDDLAFPVLANLGEQEVKSKEVYFSFDATDDDGNNELWGYNPRYYQYKFLQDRVSGDFRDTLLFWHLSRKFVARPVLDETFLTVIDETDDEEPLSRIFAVQDGTDYFWMQIFHKMHAKRPMSYYGVPTLIG